MMSGHGYWHRAARASLLAGLIPLAAGCNELREADPLHAAQADSSAAGYTVGVPRTDPVSAPPRVPASRPARPRVPSSQTANRDVDTSRAPTLASREPTGTARDTAGSAASARRDSTTAGGARTPTRPVPDVATMPPELSAPADDSVIVNAFLSYNPSARTVWVDLIAGFDGANGALNFNGGFEGAHTLIVPVGWRVEARFQNRDRELSHSAIVIQTVDPIPMLAPPAAFPNAFTISLEEGILEGRGDVVRFTADTEGRYAILCAVPGHGQSGMWVRLDVTRGATAPEYRRR